jgi:hypothetical protein
LSQAANEHVLFYRPDHETKVKGKMADTPMFGGGGLSLTAGFAALNLARFALAATGLAVEPNNWFGAEINLETASLN